MKNVRNKLLATGACALCALSTHTYGIVKVFDRDGNDITNTNNVTVVLSGGEYDVTIVKEYEQDIHSDLEYYIDGDAGDKVRSIVVDIDNQTFTGQAVYLRINKYNGFEFGLSTPIVLVQDISRAGDNPSPVFLRRVDMPNGDLGSINVHVIDVIQDVNNITGNIIITSPIPNSVPSSPGFITNITTSGAITGDISVGSGTISTITCDSIGTAGNLTSIIANKGIGSIVATNDIHSQIESLNISTSEGLYELQARRFDGQLSIKALSPPTDSLLLNPNITLSGGLDGDVFIADSYKNDTSGQMAILPVINVPAGELKGSILIDADNMQAVPGTDDFWDADVKIGTLVLNSEGYTDLPSALGGGSVGVVPYGKHLKASVPEFDNSEWTGQSLTTIDTVVFEFYGPLKLNAGAVDPVIIEEAMLLNSCLEGAYTDITSSFTITMDPNNPQTITITELSPDTIKFNKWYRIRPTADLLCATPGVLFGTIQVDQTAEIRFRTNRCTFPPPPPNPCESCQCPINCLYICNPCFGFASTTQGRDSVTNTNGKIYDELLVNKNGSHVQHWWLYPGPLGPNAADGRAVTSTNRPDAHASPDIDRDGDVDGDDLNLLMVSFGCLDCIDLDGDWDQDAQDLEVLMKAWTGPASPSVK